MRKLIRTIKCEGVAFRLYDNDTLAIYCKGKVHKTMEDIELYYLIDREFNGLYNTIVVYSPSYISMAVVELKRRWKCATWDNRQTKLTHVIEINMNSFVSKDIHD